MILFILVLWQATSIAWSKRRKLDEPSKILNKYHAAVDLFLDPFVDFEDESLQPCEMNPFTNGRFFQESQDDKVVKFNAFQQMADEMRNGKGSEYKTYLAIVVVAFFLVVGALVSYVRKNYYLKKSLKETTAECKRLREELSERELSEKEKFHNIQETNY